MRRLLSTHTLTTILAVIILIACHSKTDPVSARTPYRFHDAPAGLGNNPLSYDTLGAERQRVIHELDDYFESQTRIGFNGSVLVGYKGNVIYERYFGYANKEGGRKLNVNSSSQLASISKTFTGAAILYLYQRKYLDINEPVQHYLKDFPYPNITIKCLLDHRSGLADYTKWVGRYKKDTRTPISNDEMMQMMIKYKPALEFRPNTRFKYCNTNYAVLAYLLQEVTEMNYNDFMRKYVFEPLGMKHTFVYNPKAGLPVNAAISYNHRWQREQDMFADGVWGDKGIYSTVEDMYRWDQSFYHNTLLSNETIELAYGPCSFEKPGIKNYGLGWRMLCYPNGNKIIYHNGWWHGNNTSFYRFIKENFTIIILGNKYCNAIYHQAPHVFSIVKGTPEISGFDTED